MLHMKTPVLSDIQRVLSENEASEPNMSLMKKGEDAYQLFKSEIYKLIKK